MESRKIRGSRSRFAYKKSRSVQLCKDPKMSTRSMRKREPNVPYLRKMKKIQQRHRYRKKHIECPGAPHNTTSFLINFHKRDSSTDLVGKYGRDVPNICDRYEVESVIQT